jgi:dihydroneopterin aldolase
MVKFSCNQSKAHYGILGIKQHQIQCIVGIYPNERVKEQSLFIDVKIKLDLSACLASGQMEDTVDYVLIAQACTELAQKNQYVLLETFAFDLLDHCLKHFRAEWAWVRIQKPSALPSAACAFVEFERSKSKD